MNVNVNFIKIYIFQIIIIKNFVHQKYKLSLINFLINNYLFYRSINYLTKDYFFSYLF